jgi:hypothetical protein
MNKILLKKLIEEIKKFKKFKKLNIFCDSGLNCSANVYNFLNIEECEIKLSFFQSGHSKSSADSLFSQISNKKKEFDDLENIKRFKKKI